MNGSSNNTRFPPLPPLARGGPRTRPQVREPRVRSPGARARLLIVVVVVAILLIVVVVVVVVAILLKVVVVVVVAILLMVVWWSNLEARPRAEEASRSPPRRPAGAGFAGCRGASSRIKVSCDARHGDPAGARPPQLPRRSERRMGRRDGGRRAIGTTYTCLARSPRGPLSGQKIHTPEITKVKAPLENATEIRLGNANENPR